MNTRFIETFVTLAQLRNYRATARALHATPAAISLRIKSLEDDLRTVLVDRNAKEFRLTADGEYLLGYAKSVLAAARNLQTAANKENPIRGRLRLGVIETVVHSWLSLFIKQLSADYPDLEVDLTVDMSTVLQKRLLENELDLIVRVEGIDHPEIVSTALALYPVEWIARQGLIAPHAKDLIRRVLQHPILTFARGTAPQRALDEIVANLANQEDIPLAQTRITCSPSVAAIVKLVKDGYGIAAIPGLFVSDYLESGEFIELPIQPTPPSIIVTMCHHADTELMIHAAAKVVKQACSQFGTQIPQSFIGVLC